MGSGGRRKVTPGLSRMLIGIDYGLKAGREAVASKIVAGRGLGMVFASGDKGRGVDDSRLARSFAPGLSGFVHGIFLTQRNW